MSHKTLKQYLELIQYSGVEEILIPAKNNRIDNNSSISDSVEHNKQSENVTGATKLNTVEELPDTVTKKEESTQIDRNLDIELRNDGSASHKKHSNNGFSKKDKFDANRIDYQNCNKCNLMSNRLNFVYGEGNPDAKMMLIGEGPGSEENKQGKPFVGRAGKLLTKMLAAIHLERSDVFITNVVKCQPPGNRNPLPEEVSACLPYLWEQIDIIKPELIILLGKVAASSLLDTNEALGKLRLRKFTIKGIETYVTYHPAALLRNPAFKKLSWIDLQKYRDILGIVEHS